MCREDGESSPACTRAKTEGLSRVLGGGRSLGSWICNLGLRIKASSGDTNRESRQPKEN